MDASLTRDDVFEILKQMIADALRTPAANVRLDSNLFVDLDAESIDLVDIRFRVEQKFGIQVEQERFVKSLGADEPADIQKSFTVDRMVAFVMDELSREHGR